MFRHILALRYKNPIQGAMLFGAVFESLCKCKGSSNVYSHIVRSAGEYSVGYITFSSNDFVDLSSVLDNDIVDKCLFNLSLMQSRNVTECVSSALSINNFIDKYDLYFLTHKSYSDEFTVAIFNSKPEKFSKKLILNKSKGFSLNTLTSIVQCLCSMDIEQQVDNAFTKRDYCTTDSDEFYKYNSRGISIKAVVLCLHLDILDSRTSSNILRLIDNWLSS